MKNTYKKIGNEWGAWINLNDEYDGTLKTMEPGTEVEITTRAGEIHTRIVKETVKSYKSGCVVRLEPDQEIARVANARYVKKVMAKPYNGRQVNHAVLHSQGIPCPKCGTYCYGDCEAS